jgi:hypothetical protein
VASRTYTLSGKNLTIIAGPVTLAFINPSANVGLRLLRAWCSQRGSQASQNLNIQLSTQVTAFPTLVSATPATHHVGPGTPPVSTFTGATNGAAGTCGVNASAEGAGAKTIILPDAFNVLNGWLYVPTPADEPIELAAGIASGLGLVLDGTALTLTGWTWGLTFAELA